MPTPKEIAEKIQNLEWLEQPLSKPLQRELADDYLRLSAEVERLTKPLADEPLSGIEQLTNIASTDSVYYEHSSLLLQEIRRLRAVLEERETEWEYRVTNPSWLQPILCCNREVLEFTLGLDKVRLEATVERRRKAGLWEPLPAITEKPEGSAGE